MAKIRWTEEATSWLEEIQSYIGRDNPSAAHRVVRGIYDQIQMLAEFPELGYRYTDRPDKDIRILLYGHYRIAYLVYEDEEVVEIVGIYHGALDLDRYLN